MRSPLGRLLFPALGIMVISAALLWLLAGGCSVDREIVKPVEKRDLTQEEIRAKLTSREFKDKLAGEKQIDKLGPEERLGILLSLSQDPDPAVRLIAVKHLSKMDHPSARERLAQLAQKDPDPTVRDLAGGK